MALQASANPSQLAETKYSTTETIMLLGNMQISSQILFLGPQGVPKNVLMEQNHN